jgi:hypothetical protein
LNHIESDHPEEHFMKLSVQFPLIVVLAVFASFAPAALAATRPSSSASVPTATHVQTGSGLLSLKSFGAPVARPASSNEISRSLATTARVERTLIRPATSVTSSSSCTIPLARDTYDGFHVGVPAGWDLSTLDGTVAVSKNPSGTDEAVIYPALLTKGVTQSKLFTAYMNRLKSLTDSAGNSMTYHVTSKAGQPPAASIAAHVGKLSITGHAQVRVLPNKTAHGTSLAAVTAYWAPTASFSGQKAQLNQVGACYGPQAGTLDLIVQAVGDQPFTYAIPLGWKILGQGQDALEIADGTGAANTASATYLLTLVSSNDANSPSTLQNYLFRNLATINSSLTFTQPLKVSRVLSAVHLPNQVSSGAVLGQEYVEFTGAIGGKAVHGLVYILSDTGGGVTSGVMRLALTKTSAWNANNGVLIHVIGSIQHNFTQDLETWEHINQQWQQFDQNFQAFDDALNGVDLVEDPATGAQLEAPYESFNPNGPDGPGYYDGSTPLKVITP